MPKSEYHECLQNGIFVDYIFVGELDYNRRSYSIGSSKELSLHYEYDICFLYCRFWYNYGPMNDAYRQHNPEISVIIK